MASPLGLSVPLSPSTSKQAKAKSYCGIASKLEDLRRRQNAIARSCSRNTRRSSLQNSSGVLSLRLLHNGQRAKSMASLSSAVARGNFGVSTLRSVHAAPVARLRRSARASANGASAPVAEAPLPPPTEPLRNKDSVLIVGGGPSGVAAAIALAKLRGWTRVTIVDRAHDLAWADPDRSYVYSIDGRGMKLAEILGFAEDLKAVGVNVCGAELTKVTADGKAEVRPLNMSSPSRTTYWMPRSVLMQVLVRQVEAHNAAATSKEQQIEVLTTSRVLRLERVPGPNGDGQRLAALVQTASGEKRALYPSLVLGCDGINSTVRTTLHEWAGQDAIPGAPTFGLRTYPSPATGLRFKVLRLPPNPVTRTGQVLPNPSFGVLVGKYKGRMIRLGMLPVRDFTAGCTGNIITKPDHPFWDIPIGDVAAYRNALREAFPQIDLDAQVSEDVMTAFANSKGGVFPAPQASDGMAFVVYDRSSRSSSESNNNSNNNSSSNSSISSSESMPSAVLLVGDSAHAFPPDLGQGVNSALEDVEVLLHNLETKNDSLADVAEAYGKDRTPEADALARLVQIGYPYQYQQDFWRAQLFLLGFAMRLALCKVFGQKLVAPPAFMMVQDVRLAYTESLRRTIETRKRIATSFAGIATFAVLVIIRGVVLGA